MNYGHLTAARKSPRRSLSAASGRALARIFRPWTLVDSQDSPRGISSSRRNTDHMEGASHGTQR